MSVLGGFAQAADTVRSRPFVRNVTVLLSGAVAAKAVTVAASPALSRLYAPEAFGVLGIFAAMLAISSTAVCLRYPLAIVLPRSSRDAAAVLWLAAAVGVSVTVVVGVGVIAGRERMAQWMEAPGLTTVLWLFPLVLLVRATVQILEHWFIRQRGFRSISASHASRSVGTVGTQLSAGLAGWGPVGLVGGVVVGQIVGATMLIRSAWRGHRATLRAGCRAGRMRQVARRYADYPRYSTLAAFAGTATNQSPPLLLGLFFSPTVVGLYWFTDRLLQMVRETVGQSVQQVFFQRASELDNAQQPVFPLFWKATGALALLGLLPAVPLLALGPELFELIFGEAWREAGLYARWLVMAWIGQLMVMPTSMLLAVLSLQKWNLVWGSTSSVILLTALVLGAATGDPLRAVACFAVTHFVLHMGLIVVIGVVALRRDRHRGSGGTC